MVDKYPGVSPYAYCVWNPVRMVDPEGMEHGDYFDIYGNYLGWDGCFDNKVHIVIDGSSIKKDKNGLIDQNRVTSLISTTYKTLEATLEVFNRTKENGGKKEESTAVVAGSITINGKQGYTGDDGNPHCNFPYITEEQMSLGVTSIHSHTFVIEGDGYRGAKPSLDDKILFGACEMNIIVGYISAPNVENAYPYSTDNIGAAFINSSMKEMATMSMRSIGRIVSNRYKLSRKHMQQLMKKL